MKKIIIAIIVLAMIVTATMAFVGCGSSADYNVGIVQFAPHTALDASNAAFKQTLEELMSAQGKTIKFIEGNANGDVANATTSAETLVNRNVDLIFAIATPAAQAVAGATKSIPMVFTAVTSATTAGLTASNITGASDLNDVKKQVELMSQLVPGATKFGILYSTDEPNSELQKNLAVEEMKAIGLSENNIVIKGITDMNDVQNAFTSFKAEGVQAIYIPTDNRLAEGAASVHSANTATGANIPIVCGETGMNTLCGVATYGVNYSKLGEKSAQIAFDILFNGKKPSDIAVVNPEVTIDDFSLNEKIAEAIGFTIPEEVKALAK